MIQSPLRAVLSAAMLMAASLTSMPILADTIIVGGVGSLTPLVRLLGDEYAKKRPGMEVRVIEPPMGSNGALRALAAGKIDLALSARTLKAEETGQALPWLQTPLVMATMDGKLKGLTTALLADIYGGRKTTWDDGKPIRLVLRSEQETETRVLRSLSPAVDAAVADALKRPGLPIAENDLDAIDNLVKISGSLGTTNLGLLKASGSRLTALPLDGVTPSVKSLETGDYRLVRQFHLITAASPSKPINDFVIWLQTPAAMALVRKLEYASLK